MKISSFIFDNLSKLSSIFLFIFSVLSSNIFFLSFSSLLKTQFFSSIKDKFSPVIYSYLDISKFLKCNFSNSWLLSSIIKLNIYSIYSILSFESSSLILYESKSKQISEYPLLILNLVITLGFNKLFSSISIAISL